MTPTVARADEAPAPTLTGTLRTPEGKPIPDAVITVSVEPTADQMLALPAGSEVHPTDVGWGYSWDDGSFSTWIADPTTLVGARDADGLISLVLTAPTDEGQVFYRSRVTLGDDGVLRPFADDVAADSDAADRQAGLSAMAVAPNGRPAFDLVATQVTPTESRGTTTVAEGRDCPATMICATGSVLNESESARTDRPAYDAAVAAGNAQKSASGKTFDPDVWCGGNHWYLKKSGDVSNRNVTMADQSTGKHSTGTFEYKTTKNTSLEIGVTNRAGALVTTLGMTKGTNVNATIKGTIGKNVNAEWWVSYGLNMYDVMCQSNTTYKKWWSGYTQYRAKGFTGSSNRRTWTPFSCNSGYRNTIGPDMEISVAKEKTTTRSGAFGVGNATSGNLKATQTWSSSVGIGYKSDGTGFDICGYKGRWYTGVTKTREVA
ncbi:hypothetical protein COUCH_01880 [Couchioplanes caeruleus]|uniref:hypothetical protein n=1 Tax=Couchioplanes caeruleus TaxID=56438 RepID=UPI0020C0BFD5|nr:hypothetical protein [Couchioplanes caeruleus]UQU65127.1 hypothetical protein COUCH_01880 [Couchioplanes caeruleus]